MIAALAGLLLQVATPSPPAGGPEFPVQLGARLTPDTVTVGQRFVAVFRIRAPRGATIQFPLESDSAAKASPTAVEMIGKPAVEVSQDSLGVIATAAYRFVAWDVGDQRLGFGDAVVGLNGKPGYVSLASTHVFVRSVLPADTTKRALKPPRQLFGIKAFDWRPWLYALGAVALAAILWRLFVWYRRRRSAPLDPFRAAERDFARIEAMGLVAAGEGERHAALMSGVMRDYLSVRAPGVTRSQTSSEMLASANWIHGVAKGFGELLWRTDLIKFAATRVSAEEGEKLGAAAKSVVRSVEEHLLEEEEKAVESRKAA